MNVPSASGPRAGVSRRTVLTAAVVALLLPVAFALFSRQVWEDYYITYRSSRNLAEGHGLVYQLGERVHTFTSPLGVLLPALGFFLTHHDTAALWFFRLVSALALAGAALLVAAHARDQRWPAGAAWFALCLGVFEAKIVAFSANGMETALVMLFAALAWRELTRPSGPRPAWLAAAFAGLMWTRPDGFLVAGAMAAGWWLCGPRRLTPGERPWWRGTLSAALIGGALYAPWFFWAWHYYGSPVPQTIIAKTAYTPGGLSLGRIVAAPLRCLVSDTALDGLFAPIYANAGGWPRDFMNVARLLARLAAFLWLAPGLSRSTRAASFAVLLGGVYLHQIMPYPWYYAPWTLLGALALAGAAATAAARLGTRLQSAGRILAGVIAAGALAVTAVQAECCRVQQQLIEDAGRKQIGLWLHAHAHPGDTVFLEPIGYIGYFSQLRILDFPGLTAPVIAQMVREHRGNYANIIATLRPVWIVLRPTEIVDQRLAASHSLEHYDVVGHWNQRPALDRRGFLPGRGWLEFDSEFLLLHRQPDHPAAPARQG